MTARPVAGWAGRGGRRRPLTVCAVVAGHAALMLVIWQARRLPVGGSELRPSVVLQLLPLRATGPQAARPFPPAVPAPGTRLAVPSVTAPVLLPGVPAGEAVAPDPAAAPGLPAGATTPGGAASGPQVLDLRPSRELLRGALVNPATLDPRSNSPKPTFEERLAMGLDPSLCVKLERDPDGTVRRRMGRLGRAQTLLQSTQGVGAMGASVCE